MRELLNQHSYLLLAAAVLVVATLITFRFGTWPPRATVLAIAVLLLAAAHLALRTAPSSSGPPERVEALLLEGSPTLLEFYSNF